MDLDPPVAFVLDRFNGVEASHVPFEIDAGSDALTLRYVAGEDGDCVACVLDPDDLDVLVADALQRQGASTTTVTILR